MAVSLRGSREASDALANHAFTGAAWTFSTLFREYRVDLDGVPLATLASLLLTAAGPEGLTTVELSRLLGLDIKRSGKALAVCHSAPQLNLCLALPFTSALVDALGFTLPLIRLYSESCLHWKSAGIAGIVATTAFVCFSETRVRCTVHFDSYGVTLSQEFSRRNLVSRVAERRGKCFLYRYISKDLPHFQALLSESPSADAAGSNARV